MATKKRRGSAKRTYTSQEAARKRGAAGKRFVGETAAQSAKDRRRERGRAARRRGASRKAKPAEAARTAGAKRPRRGGAAEPTPWTALDVGGTEALRAAAEDAARAGAEVEPVDGPLATVSHLPTRDAAAERARELDAEAAARAVAAESWGGPSADVSAEHAATGGEEPPRLGWALADLVRSAFGLARTVATAPFRLALAVPRFALRAVLS